MTDYFRKSRVKAKLKRGEPVLMTSADLSEQTVELASVLGVDAVWIDTEHQSADIGRVATLVRAARTGTADAIVRVPRHGFNLISRVLETGAHGVIYPHCESAEEAAEAVAWSRFAPLGHRPAFGLNADGVYGLLPLLEYVAAANEEVYLGIIIETPAALDAVGEIAAVPGVDFLYFGIGDFSVAGGITDFRGDPRIPEAEQKVAEAARAAGIAWGAAAGNVDAAARLVSAGALVLSHGRDIVYVREGLVRSLAELRTLGGGIGGGEG
jgi:4-hydroxy-2-oxoheptanedioate aldolase